MLPVTFNGESVYLLPYRPNWATPFFLSLTIPVNVDRSLSGRSKRTPMADTAREALKYTLLLKDANSSAYRVALQRLGSQKILCPFWPSAHLHYTGAAVYIAPDGSVYTAPDGSVYMSGSGETAWLTTGIWLTFEPGLSTYEVHTTDTPAGFTPSLAAVRVPLLLGYFKSRPVPTATTDSRISGAVEFVQSSPADYALRPLPLAPSFGPSLGGRSIPLFNFLINWATRPIAGGADYVTDQSNIGNGRELVVTAYPQDAERRIEATVLCRDWAKIAALASFFYARHGQADSFWLPGLLSECRLVATTSASSAVVQVDQAAGLGDNRYIAFTRPGAAPVCRHVESVDLAANTLTLDSPPGVFFPGQINLVSLILSRFSKPTLELAFATDSRTTSRIEFLETPAEYFTPAGEILGSTMGGTPTEAWLYRFIRRYPAETVVDRFTGFERDLIAGGELYLHRAIEHASLVDADDPDETTVDLTADRFAGNPLALLFTQSLDIPLELEISRCKPAADGTAGSVELLFTGVIGGRKPKAKGPRITAQAVHQLNILQEKVPVPEIQPECNWDFGTAPCGINLANWTWSAVVVALSGTSLTLGSFVRTNGGASIVFGPSYFYFGQLWCGSAEADYSVRTIYGSTALAVGQLTVTVSHGFLRPPAVGSTVYLRPGCNGSIAWCRDKYANYSGEKGFGGFPFVPAGNPSFIAIRTSPTTSSKK